MTEETRSRVIALSLVPLLDLGLILLIAFLVLHGTARWALIAVGLVATFVVWLRLSGLLFRPHLLTGEGLVVRQGFGFLLNLRFAEIEAIQPYRGVIPASLRAARLLVAEAEERLFCLAGESGLVEVVLRNPVDVVVRSKHFPVQSVVVNLNDVPAFLSAASAKLPSVQPQAQAKLAQVAVHPPRPIAEPQRGDESIALSVQGLRKSYRDVQAVDGVTFRVRHGQVFGFLGSNGAGKTTSIRMIAGLLPPDAGTIAIAGHDVSRDPIAARRSLGYVPDVPVLYDQLTGREYLWLVGELFDLPPAEARRRAEELTDSLGIAHAADRMSGTYSLGMKRKLSIAAALLHRPKVLLLDEPTNGLDPRSSYEVKRMISSLSSAGVGVLLATHHLDVVEELASEIGIIDFGRMVAVGSMEQLRSDLNAPGTTLEQLFLTLTTVGKG
ncbi:MAG: ABC transporter ATP-binding protein [Symbiobacteriia bacterium]